MHQSDCLIKAVIECLRARFDEDKNSPDGFPIPLKMGVDEDREGQEYALFQVSELDEIIAGHRTFHAGVSVDLFLCPGDRTTDEIRVMQAWLEDGLRKVDREGLNAVEGAASMRNFLVIGPVRLAPAEEVAAHDSVMAVGWKMTVPVQF